MHAPPCRSFLPLLNISLGNLKILDLSKRFDTDASIKMFCPSQSTLKYRSEKSPIKERVRVNFKIQFERTSMAGKLFKLFQYIYLKKPHCDNINYD